MYHFRTTTSFNLPAKICCGQLVSVKVVDQVADRVFYIGGKGATGTPVNLDYEWTETSGWTRFSTLPTMTSYTDLVTMVYNTQ